MEEEKGLNIYNAYTRRSLSLHIEGTGSRRGRDRGKRSVDRVKVWTLLRYFGLYLGAFYEDYPLIATSPIQTGQSRANRPDTTLSGLWESFLRANRSVCTSLYSFRSTATRAAIHTCTHLSTTCVSGWREIASTQMGSLHGSVRGREPHHRRGRDRRPENIATCGCVRQ